MGQDEMLKQPRRSSRLIAFLGVVFSTVSITSCLISFPLIFNYIQTLQANVQTDLEYCRGRSRDLWREVLQMKDHSDTQSERLSKAIETFRPIPTGERQKRQAAATNAPAGSCCTCHRGPVGPPGPAGNDGRPGMDMDEGEPGKPGDNAKLNYDPASLLPKDCPCTAAPGDQGAAGPKGSPGPAGKDGVAGEDGKAGDNGVRGEQGKGGEAGKAGAKGPTGEDGPVIPAKDLPQGPAGKAGENGADGKQGETGKAGKDGPNGPPGAQGDQGAAGKDGAKGGDGKPGANGGPGPKGSCTHCPPPRTAPGY